jgi:hypothetical protein
MIRFCADVADVKFMLNNLSNNPGGHVLSGNIADKIGVMLEETGRLNSETCSKVSITKRYDLIKSLTTEWGEIMTLRENHLRTILDEHTRDDRSVLPRFSHAKEEVVPDQYYNTEIKKCPMCRSLSNMNILTVTDEKECPICTNIVNRMMTFKCGHTCCCFNCFKLPPINIGDA